ncbi:MAG TPA: AMP-binding protein [Saprospiraceae bacterium]|nr:AMP-binding protein [Saprospiraceae bacterium]HPI06516.1 AMP-binding protein [Saprospiraceae bacterium]
MEKPWLQNYPAGVPVNIDPNQYPRLLDMLEECFQKYHDLPAFVFMGKTLTFGEVDAYSTAFAAYLHSRGLEPGDRIALMMPNALQYPIALFGCLRAGLILVNTNPLYTPREMKHQFIDSGAKAIIIAENFAANLQQVIGETQIKTVILTSVGEMLGMRGILVNFVVRKIRKMVPKFSLPNTVAFKDALKQGRKFTVKPFKSTADDTIALQYTGGTTGVSKGAMLTNRNLVANMLQIKAWLSPVLEEREVVALCPLPLYHIFAFTVNCLAFMLCGGKNILIVNARDLPALIKEWRTHNPNIVTGVNTLFNGMLNNPEFNTLDFSNLKATVGGGMAVQRAVAERWQQVTGCQLTEGYGMTESSPVLTVNPVDKSMRLGTIGMPVSSTELRIADEQGNTLLPGPENVGEIQAKGPQIMKGYWQRPEATAETIKDGWLCTGDMGFMHPDGFFQIVDRKKDMILVSGFNVYPNEIEDVLAMHPKILESAALGLADEKSGEVVQVFIVKKDPSLTEAEVIAHCRANLTGYKVPKKVQFRTDLPKTNVGKILRRELRDK